MRKRLGFKSCPIHSNGFVGTPIKKELVDSKDFLRCKKCRCDYGVPELVEDNITRCPRCNGELKPARIWREYCPKCREESIRRLA